MGFGFVCGIAGMLEPKKKNTDYVMRKMAKLKYVSGEAIITDAGWDSLSYEQALCYFSAEELERRWLEYTEEMEIEDICKMLGVEIPDLEDDEAMDAMWSLRPKSISVVTAKACYQEKKWIAVVALGYEWRPFEDHERKAIQLGIQLRADLHLDLPVVNDNRDAVILMRKKYPNIQWARRNRTKQAHNLKLSQPSEIVELREE